MPSIGRPPTFGTGHGEIVSFVRRADAKIRLKLVRRTRTQKDRRAYRLTLTRAGEKLLRQLTECARAHEEKLDAVIGARERAQFLRILRRLANEMD